MSDSIFYYTAPNVVNRKVLKSAIDLRQIHKPLKISTLRDIPFCWIPMRCEATAGKWR
jgi:hypothetical protein